MTEALSPNIKLVSAGMRGMLLLASVLVFLVAIPLIFLSDQTEDYFAWTINPPLTAAFLGGAYWSAFVLEFLSSREPFWARARPAVPAVLIFTTLTLTATLIHFDRFHRDPFAWIWLSVYAVVPPLLLSALIQQIRRPGGDPPGQMALPVWIRGLSAVIGLSLIVLGTALFVAPEQTADLWVWALTPLTSRAVGAWLIGFGIVLVQIAWENEVRNARATAYSTIVFAILQSIALFRFSSTLDWGRAGSWLYLLFLAGVLAIGVGVLAALRQMKQPVMT